MRSLESRPTSWCHWTCKMTSLKQQNDNIKPHKNDFRLQNDIFRPTKWYRQSHNRHNTLKIGAVKCHLWTRKITTPRKWNLSTKITSLDTKNNHVLSPKSYKLVAKNDVVSPAESHLEGNKMSPLDPRNDIFKRPKWLLQTRKKDNFRHTKWQLQRTKMTSSDT